jgi:DNA-binding CsgD family transcriptional regulator
VLLGRDEERLALDRLMAEARVGSSGVIALVGEPGIGKTSLLEYAAERAEGMNVLRARGIQSEARIPFAGLLELLRPALSRLERIPAPQKEALAGALALAPAGEQARFAVGAATLSLLAAYAEESPLLLLLDDAQWLDGSSAEAILFAIRRLVADPIAVVISVREGDPSLLDGADLRVVRLGGLDRAAAAELLDVAPEIGERLYAATAGNPLALLELARDASQLAAVPLDVPLPISTSIGDAFLRRLGSLEESTRRLLVLAAASDSSELGLLERAAARLGLETGELAKAEAERLVDLADGTIEFRHPLVRSAVYANASPDERREVHRALADTLPDREVDRRAWHLAAAVVGPDDSASTALEQAGERARERSAYAVAAPAFERAARLAADDERSARVFLRAADAAWLAGLAGRALVLLDEAQSRAQDADLRVRIDHLRGYVVLRSGAVTESYELLTAAAEETAGRDPELAVLILADAVDGCLYSGDAYAARRTAERIKELLPQDATARTIFFASMAEGTALIVSGEGEAGAAAVRRATDLLESLDELPDDARMLAWTTIGALFLREAEAGRALIERGLTRAREVAAVGVLPALLNHVGRDEATAGARWPEAEARFHESIRLARETGQRIELAAALAGLAWLEARQGKTEACHAHAKEAHEICTELGLGLYGIWPSAALGELELGLGDAAAAAAQFESQAAQLRALGVGDVDVSPAPELVEAYLRLGRSEEAASLAAEYSERAAEKGQPWALARAARAKGLLAPDEQLEEWFADALRLHARTPDLFETARTHLAYGARLRRARQRLRAREELRAALELFDRLGAAPWAEQANAELAATGETARRRVPSTLDDLTPQELQIALLLARGQTTREAAASLFLSPKTIEYHLRNVYRKLDIHSREELAGAFSEQALATS